MAALLHPRRFWRKFQVEILWDFPNDWRTCTHIGCGCGNGRLFPTKQLAEEAMEKHIQQVLQHSGGSIKEKSLRGQVRVKAKQIRVLDVVMAVRRAS